MSDHERESQLAVALSELRSLATDMAELRATMTRLAEAVTRLAVMEERQGVDRESIARAFKALDKHDERLRTLEHDRPLQQQTSAWVRRAAGLVLAAVLGAGVSTVVRGPGQRAPSHYDQPSHTTGEP